MWVQIDGQTDYLVFGAPTVLTRHQNVASRGGGGAIQRRPSDRVKIGTASKTSPRIIQPRPLRHQATQSNKHDDIYPSRSFSSQSPTSYPSIREMEHVFRAIDGHMSVFRPLPSLDPVEDLSESAIKSVASLLMFNRVYSADSEAFLKTLHDSFILSNKLYLVPRRLLLQGQIGKSLKWHYPHLDETALAFHSLMLQNRSGIPLDREDLRYLSQSHFGLACNLDKVDFNDFAKFSMPPMSTYANIATAGYYTRAEMLETVSKSLEKYYYSMDILDDFSNVPEVLQLFDAMYRLVFPFPIDDFRDNTTNSTTTTTSTTTDKHIWDLFYRVQEHVYLNKKPGNNLAMFKLITRFAFYVYHARVTRDEPFPKDVIRFLEKILRRMEISRHTSDNHYHWLRLIVSVQGMYSDWVDNWNFYSMDKTLSVDDKIDKVVQSYQAFKRILNCRAPKCVEELREAFEQYLAYQYHFMKDVKKTWITAAEMVKAYHILKKKMVLWPMVLGDASSVGLNLGDMSDRFRKVPLPRELLDKFNNE